ncbi:MAG: hypothetical protein A2W58_01020 [Candidatus Zambryskibacteria bacterium RIFCSPHIGHO2_02_38_10.5]|uniref:Methyltransferase domain-containing protein n=1 Tax=Candidatus Zambryskibacteria bacterium RIFCSPHIGHO2_02_38_10.5 TaxID=1802742 RepID=A0A1G2T9V6_9BACT|nr:MAG: hypothetical protein A2W58_01020 [Candidatus Zambryskibacteria bacterium RIFCSPHIGHO2_02_38_10.5]
MAQEKVWDREYGESKLLTKDNIPQNDILRFVKFLKKKPKMAIDKGLLTPSVSKNERLVVLDLGSGTGRNSYYFASLESLTKAEFGSLGNTVTGLEISQTAIDIAKKNLKSAEGFIYDISYIKQSIGETFPFENNTFDIVLDVTSSNSLSEAEREVYMAETYRVLKSGGYFFVKALCKDGDVNAKNLLKQFPGKEKDTYVMPEINLTERVWSKDDFTSFYKKYFTILHLEKKTSYPRMNQRSYKRNFWIAYMKK